MKCKYNRIVNMEIHRKKETKIINNLFVHIKKCPWIIIYLNKLT